MKELCLMLSNLVRIVLADLKMGRCMLSEGPRSYTLRGQIIGEIEGPTSGLTTAIINAENSNLASLACAGGFSSVGRALD